MLQLSSFVAAKRLWESEDVALTKAWLQDLKSIGYLSADVPYDWEIPTDNSSLGETETISSNVSTGNHYENILMTPELEVLLERYHKRRAAHMRGEINSGFIWVRPGKFTNYYYCFYFFFLFVWGI
jgi:hypothetical protein